MYEIIVAVYKIVIEGTFYKCKIHGSLMVVSIKEGVSKSTPSLFSTKPRLSQAGALLLPKDFVSLSLKIYTYGKDTFSSLHSQPNGTISAKNR